LPLENLENGKKKNPFQKVQKPLDCLAQGVSENTILMLCLRFFLWWSAGGADLDPSSDNARGYLANACAVLWKHKMEISCSPAEGCKFVWEKLKARCALVTLHVFPLVKQNCQSAKCFTANSFLQRKKAELMNLGKENSVLASQNLSHSCGTLCFSLPD